MRMYFDLKACISTLLLLLLYTFTLSAQKWPRHYDDFSILRISVKSLTATQILLNDFFFL